MSHKRGIDVISGIQKNAIDISQRAYTVSVMVIGLIQARNLATTLNGINRGIGSFGLRLLGS